MASSEDNNNDGEMGFQHRGEMSSGSMFNKRSSSGSGNPFGSGWDPLESFGGSSSMVVGGGSSAYPVGLETHQGLLHHYPSGSGIGDFGTKLGSFGSGSFSEMVNPFVNLNPECGGQRVAEENNNNNNASSPNTREKRRAPHSQFNPIKNGEREQRNDGSGDSSGNMNGQDEKKQKTEHGVATPSSRGKQLGKQAKDNSDSGGGAPKDSYIHVRAKRGQATNSHSLAERVRRERISERMKLLQELVPGCNKITGKAVMLDEIINYVQSLQQQVEFLSMKLATVNPELNIDIERLVFKDILYSRDSSSNQALLGFAPGLTTSQPYQHGNLPGVPATTPPLHPPQPIWDNDLHNLLQMGFDANMNNLGPNGRTKLDL